MPILPLSIMSTKRPGVATKRWQPRSKSRICCPISAPPYTTHGRTRDRYANWGQEHNAKEQNITKLQHQIQCQGSWEIIYIILKCIFWNIYSVSSDYLLFWLHHRSAMPALLSGPRPERWDTVCVGHIYRSPVNRTSTLGSDTDTAFYRFPQTLLHINS